MSFDTRSSTSLPDLDFLLDIHFLENLSIFSEKNCSEILNVLRKLLNLVAFYKNFATFWWRKVSRSGAWTKFAMVIVHHRLKNVFVEWRSFLPFNWKCCRKNDLSCWCLRTNGQTIRYGLVQAEIAGCGILHDCFCKDVSRQRTYYLGILQATHHGLISHFFRQTPKRLCFMRT